MTDRSLRSMAVVWLAHVVFLGLYVWVAVDRAQTVREGHGFFSSPWASWTVAAPAALVALVGGTALRGRMRWSGACLLRWSLAEIPALVGIVGFLAGGTWAFFGWHLAVSGALLLWLVPTAGRKAGWGSLPSPADQTGIERRPGDGEDVGRAGGGDVGQPLGPDRG